MIKMLVLSDLPIGAVGGVGSIGAAAAAAAAGVAQRHTTGVSKGGSKGWWLRFLDPYQFRSTQIRVAVLTDIFRGLDPAVVKRLAFFVDDLGRMALSITDHETKKVFFRGRRPSPPSLAKYLLAECILAS